MRFAPTLGWWLLSHITDPHSAFRAPQSAFRQDIRGKMPLPQVPRIPIRNLKSEIRNPHSEIRNPLFLILRSAIRNPRSAIRDPHSAIHNPQYRFRNSEESIPNCLVGFYSDFKYLLTDTAQ